MRPDLLCSLQQAGVLTQQALVVVDSDFAAVACNPGQSANKDLNNAITSAFRTVLQAPPGGRDTSRVVSCANISAGDVMMLNTSVPMTQIVYEYQLACPSMRLCEQNYNPVMEMAADPDTQINSEHVSSVAMQGAFGMTFMQARNHPCNPP